MKNARGLLIAIAAIAFAGCGGDDHDYNPAYLSPPPGTYANLQVVNTSVDAPPMDIILDGQPFVTHLDYGQGTGEQSITVGSHSLVVQIETPGAPTTVIGPTTLDAAANMDYVVAVEGSVGSIQSPGLSLVTSPHELAVVPAQSTRIQVLNAYSAPIVVYLTAPGADLSSSTPLGTVSPGGSLSPTEVAAGESELQIAVPGAPFSVSYDSGPIDLQGGTDLVFSALTPYYLPYVFPPCCIVSVSAVDAFGNNAWPNAGTALRVVNDAADAPALAVTANGNLTTPIVATLAYEGSTGYLSVGGPPGAYDLAITPASNLSDVLANQTVDLKAGESYSLFALGPLARIVPFITRDNYRGYSTQARLRFIQGSPSAQVVDVYLEPVGPGTARSASPSYAAMPFATDTGFVSYAQGAYMLSVAPAGSSTSIIGPVPVNLNNGQVITIIARDAPGGGAPYGLLELDP
jgi:hypothetical protein